MNKKLVTILYKVNKMFTLLTLKRSNAIEESHSLMNVPSRLGTV